MNRPTFRTRKAAWAALATAAALCLALAPAASALDVADVRAGSGGLDFVPQVEHGGFVLTVSGPEGFHHRAEFGAGESPSFSIFDHGGGALPDGIYNYELTVVPSDTQRREAFEANQIQERSGGVRPRIQTGAFSIVGGAVVAGGETEAGAGPAGAGAVLSTKDQVIPDDLIVQRSLCVGFDCVNNEDFGFDTIRLKENNTRIKFLDTSVGSFPSTDWQLTANDSASGGQNKFSIEDVTTPRVPFTIEGGSTTNSIYVDSTGRVGFRTSTPVLDLHVATSNTPGLRLEQTSAGGFTAQTWDVAGNEANFFVRSATTGSQLPFRIRPGAPTSSIDIASDGDVGIGTASPAAKLHVENGIVLVQSTASPGFTLQDDDGTGASIWDFELNANGLFQITKDGTGGAEVLIRERGGTDPLETMDVDGEIEADAFNLSSSRTVKTAFQAVDAAEVLDRVLQLPVSEWAYTRDVHGARHIGPMAEDFTELFGVGNSSTNISVVDVSGVALAAIQGLHQVVQEKDARIQELEERLVALEDLLTRESEQ